MLNPVMQNNGTPTVVSKRYLLHQPIGAGNMGTVYEATDRLTARPIALKRVVTAPDPSVPEDERTNFNMDLRLALAHEFKMLASLRHPHIISVLDYGFDESQQPYFTMELLSGAQTLLVAGRGKPLELQVTLLHQVLQALSYLHRRGVLHRDLKPANVLVPPNTSAIKLLDFGLASFGVQIRNDSESLVGTLSYM